MKLASGEVIVWLIVAIVVAVTNGLKKLANPTASNQESVEPVRPPDRPPAVRPPADDRPVLQNPPPIVRPTNTEMRPEPRDLREFMERLSRPAPAAPAPPVVKKRPPAAPPKPAPVAQQVAMATEAPLKAAGPAPSPANLNSQWTDALRDRKNLRNVVIAMEILGPPRGA
jgi:hypothetical protein